MNKIIRKLTSSLLALFVTIGAVPAFAAPSENVQIVDIVGDSDALLLSDGSLWMKRYEPVTNPLQQLAGPSKYEIVTYDLNLVEATGNNNSGLGLTADGKLVYWTSDIAPEVVPGTGEIKQINGNYWLESDGNIRYLSTSGIAKVDNYSDIVRFEMDDKMIAAIDSKGQILTSNNWRNSKPTTLGMIPAGGIVKEVSYYPVSSFNNEAQVLLNDGRFLRYLSDPGTGSATPKTIDTDVTDVSYIDKDGGNLFVKKDGTLWELSAGSAHRINDINGVKRVDGASTEYESYYVQKNDGTWVGKRINSAYEEIDIPSIGGLVLSASSVTPYAGTTIKLTAEVKYSSGDAVSVPMDQLKLTTDRSHLIQIQKNGSLVSTGVGEATVTATYNGLQQSVKIVSSLSRPIQGGQAVKGINYIPLNRVVKAMGGTLQYDAAKKTYNVQVGETKISIDKDKKSAVANGKNITMKGASFEKYGLTFVSADLLSSALGAVVKWDKSHDQLNVSLGGGKLVVDVDSNPTELSEAPATGKMKGWKILKGHMYEKQLNIYFKYDKKNDDLTVTTESKVKVDLNRKVTWVDDAGRKHTNTIRQLYELFSLSNQYTSDWFGAKFGQIYYDYIISSIDGYSLVTQYLTESGQMKNPLKFDPDDIFAL